MKIKQTIRHLVLASVVFMSVAAPLTYADTSYARCAGVETSIINCNEDNVNDANGDGTVDEKDTGVWALLLLVINILTAGVGVIALGGIIYGSILYTAAGGNPEQVKKARGIFTNVVIGIVAFAGMWALLNFIIPGGVL